MTEENKFLKSLNELNKKIESSKTFLPNEILNYLKKVLNLDISVLNDSKFKLMVSDSSFDKSSMFVKPP